MDRCFNHLRLENSAHFLIAVISGVSHHWLILIHERSRIDVHMLDLHVLKAIHSLRQTCAVQIDPVGDDHDLVEDLLVVVVVQRSETVRQPGDRV